jgi:hypothetical protein
MNARMPSGRVLPFTRALAVAAVAVGLLLTPLLATAPSDASPLGGIPAQSLVVAAPAVAPGATGSSAVTVKGTGPYASLSVTVSQTKNLVDQTVDITWTGGAPTNSPTRFDANFLQIMQCWGDTSPDRSQCQFGGLAAFDTRGGENAASRQLKQALAVDGDEPLTRGTAPGQNVFVPFTSVTGVTVEGLDTLKNSFYDQTTTNEVPFARTRGDGKGFQPFEVMTGREAPGLGCGVIQEVGGHKGKRPTCWLVIVPRGTTEVDGSSYTQNSSLSLDSSPLSTTNWAHRIVVPLDFSPVGQVCSILADQTPTAGVETISEAVTRWQPALCAKNGPVFGFNQVADSVGERQLLSPQPGLGFLNLPISPSDVPEDRVMRYAPIALSGLAIAFNIDRTSLPTAPESVRAHDGERVPNLKLTPRIVAKLLTQSYVYGVGPNARYLKGNPDNLTKDPDFLALNPDFKDIHLEQSIEFLVPSGLAAVNDMLWDWIANDQEAADFLAGLPDPWGMRVNPFYQGLSVPVEAFPKLDPFCDAHAAVNAPALCTLDAHPYALDMHETARSTARGDALSRTSWDPFALPPQWKKASQQLLGQRRLLAVTDTATAQRFGLPVAQLRNPAGAFVAPTDASLLAGVSAMRPSAVKGVLRPDAFAQRTAATAYPLTAVTYAVTAPILLTAADAEKYADFIRYAVGTGQVRGTGVGQLPLGYTPISTTLRTQAIAAAADIQKRVGPPKQPSSGGSGGSGGSGRSGGLGNGGSGVGAVPSGSGGSSAGSGSGSGAAPAAPGTGSTPPATAGGQIPTSTARTQGMDVGNVRFAVVAALIFGLLGSVVGPVLRRRLARRP